MGWDLFSRKPGRNWARGDSAKSKTHGQPQQPKIPTSLKELRALRNSKPPKLTAPVGNKTKSSFFKPSLPFNIPLPVFTRGELMGSAFVGEEERELARDGGAAERGALRRRTGLMGENIRDTDEDDGDEDQQPGSRGKARRAAGTANESLTKTATSASQVLAVTAAASQLSRLAKRRR